MQSIRGSFEHRKDLAKSRALGGHSSPVFLYCKDLSVFKGTGDPSSSQNLLKVSLVHLLPWTPGLLSAPVMVLRDSHPELPTEQGEDKTPNVPMKDSKSKQVPLRPQL